MSRYNERFNSSGYPDPTAYVAIQRATLAEQQETKRKVEQRQICRDLGLQIYIASPFKGDTAANVKKALRYCRFAVKQGYLPIAPHCYLPRFMDDNDPAERKLALEFGKRLMQNCTELWVFGEIISSGMKGEIREAQRRNIRIRYFSEDMKEVTHAYK